MLNIYQHWLPAVRFDLDHWPIFLNIAIEVVNKTVQILAFTVSCLLIDTQKYEDQKLIVHLLPRITNTIYQTKNFPKQYCKMFQ